MYVLVRSCVVSYRAAGAMGCFDLAAFFPEFSEYKYFLHAKRVLNNTYDTYLPMCVGEFVRLILATVEILKIR